MRIGGSCGIRAWRLHLAARDIVGWNAIVTQPYSGTDFRHFTADVQRRVHWEWLGGIDHQVGGREGRPGGGPTVRGKVPR